MAKDEIGPVAGSVALVAVLGIMIVLIAVLALVIVNALAQSPWGTVTIGLTIPSHCSWAATSSGRAPAAYLKQTAIGIALLFVALYAGKWVAGSPDLASAFTRAARRSRGSSWDTDSLRPSSGVAAAGAA